MSNRLTENELAVKVEHAFSKTFGRQLAFHPELDRATEPQWTSLKHVEFLIALEVEFGIEFDGADATDMTKMAVVFERVRQRLA
jgi:acyl carrier protein